MIYFIQSGDSEFVKIGYAVDPKARLRQLQCGNPELLKLIAIRDGGPNDEAYWHSKFAHHRHRGEWFKWHDEIREWALPLLEDPEEMRKLRAAYCRALVAGREDERLELYGKLMGGRPWSPDRRNAFAKKKRCPEIEAEIERLNA